MTKNQNPCNLCKKEECTNCPTEAESLTMIAQDIELDVFKDLSLLSELKLKGGMTNGRFNN